MARLWVAILLALAPAAGAVRALARDADASLKERPVAKVVQMLQDMRAELQANLDDDKAVHAKLDCWCKTNEKEKTEALETGEARTNELKAILGTTQAQSAEAKSKREAQQGEVDQGHAALSAASAQRMKDNQAFHKEETQLLEAIQAVGQAITVLKAHHPELAQVRAVAHRLQKAKVFSLSALGGTKAAALKAFLEEAQGAVSFLAVPGFQSYTPQSGEVFGILQQMKEDFEKDLAAARAQEQQAVEQFAAVKEAKDAQLAAGRQSVRQLDGELASLAEKGAQADGELKDTEAKLGVDRTFSATLKEKCSESDSEFAQRVKSRMEEIGAVEDAIQILNSDESFDLFGKALATTQSFLQTSAGAGAREELRRRRAAASLLARVATAGGPRSPALVLLAGRLQLDAFTDVKKAIDKLVKQLQAQQKDEVAHRDWCIEELNDNNRSTEAASDSKGDLQTKMAGLKKDMGVAQGLLEDNQAKIQEMQAQMKAASETREAENAAFQKTVTDQRLTQIVLRRAVDRMKQVYASLLQRGDGPGAPHTALSGTDTDPGNGPARFTKYDRNAGGARVIAALERIIADAKAAEDQAVKAEQDSQAAYEAFMKESNGAIMTYSEAIANLSEGLAKLEEDMSMAKTDMSRVMSELEGLNETLGGLRKSCDYILANFDTRQAARTAEIGALGEAGAILSGMK